jgi:hypothetical protein
MKTIKLMTNEEFVQHVRLSAKMFAVRSFERANPGCTEDESWQYAERNWKQFKETALDWIAVCEADREAREAAPWN